MDYASAKASLDRLNFSGIKLGLERTVALLRHIGDPQNEYPVIHVAGTNGKGSTCAMLAHSLRAAGFTTGLFTSPHLVTFRERIEINGKIISQNRACDMIVKINHAVKSCGVELTYFEFMTAMAFLYFKEEKVDIAIIEVGMGGRFDSTNVVNSTVTVITSIALDHQAHLGKTVEAVAMEKCGIIKPGRPVVSGVRDKRIAKLIKEQAMEMEAPFFCIEEDFTCRRTGSFETGEKFSFNSSDGAIHDITLELVGLQQIGNAAVAVKTLQLLRENCIEVNETAIRKGFNHLLIPGRFEKVKKDPVIILDGAHNPDACSALGASLLERYGEKRVDFIFGAMADKDYEQMINNLSPLAKSFTFHAPEVPRAENPDALMMAQTGKNIPTRSIREMADVREFIHNADRDSIICITGSFYLIGEVRPGLLSDL